MKLKALVAPIALLVSLFMAACAPAQTTGQQVEVQFATHPAAGMAEQDVFIPGENPGEIVRMVPDVAEQYVDAPVFASTQLIEHDPMALGEDPFGPYEQGAPLGFTMGEWIAGTGTGVYSVIGDEAKLDVELANLIPNGVYTIWCSRLNFPPNFSIVDEPCGEADGSENTAIANADGTLAYSVDLNALEPSTEESMNVIGVAYHSDGKTYGNYPGDFGYNSHVQVFGFIPAPGDAAWQPIDGGAIASR